MGIGLIRQSLVGLSVHCVHPVDMLGDVGSCTVYTSLVQLNSV